MKGRLAALEPQESALETLLVEQKDGEQERHHRQQVRGQEREDDGSENHDGGNLRILKKCLHIVFSGTTDSKFEARKGKTMDVKTMMVAICAY